MRRLYPAFGVIAAAGVSSTGWVLSVILVRGWFPERIGTALGIASAGIGVGIFALVRAYRPGHARVHASPRARATATQRPAPAGS